MQKLLLFILLLPSLAVTEELRVLDATGLTRAFKNIQGRAVVRLSLSATQEPFVAELVQTDGLARDLVGSRADPKHYEFRDVGPGTWQIQVSSGQALIKEVKIEK